MTNETTTRKTMTPAQIKQLTGKRVDVCKWALPEGYGVCVNFVAANPTDADRMDAAHMLALAAAKVGADTAYFCD